jgi:hypothetical protein
LTFFFSTDFCPAGNWVFISLRGYPFEKDNTFQKKTEKRKPIPKAGGGKKQEQARKILPVCGGF